MRNTTLTHEPEFVGLGSIDGELASEEIVPDSTAVVVTRAACRTSWLALAPTSECKSQTAWRRRGCMTISQPTIGLEVILIEASTVQVASRGHDVNGSWLLATG